MTTEPRKPIFGFLWPSADPDAPVDAAYVQVRRVRVAPRGPIRIGALVLASLVLTTLTGTQILAAMSTGPTVLTVAGAALSASLLFVVLRGWVVGTFVNDHGVTIETTWRRITVPWDEVAAVECVDARAPLVGLPVRVPARRSRVVARDGRAIPTHVYTTSPDLWLRPEAFDMARLRLEQWAPHLPEPPA